MAFGDGGLGGNLYWGSFQKRAGIIQKKGIWSNARDLNGKLPGHKRLGGRHWGKNVEKKKLKMEGLVEPPRFVRFYREGSARRDLKTL